MQQRALSVLAGMEPRWTLTGGGALAGFYLGHRTTKDLDFFWHGLRELEHIPDEVERRLVNAGLQVERVQAAPMFARFRVLDEDGASTVLDLVAEPVAFIEAPREMAPGVLVDTPHEILVNKLTALFSRWAPRDLFDLKILMENGGDFDRALREAPRKDGGFSPAALAWVLQQLNLEKTPAALGFDVPALIEFRERLIDRLLS